MLKYSSYKNSSYDWLGQIPAHWKEKFLEQTASEKCVKNIGGTVKQVLSLSYGEIKKKSDLNKGLIAQDLSTYQIIEPGDIIMRLTDLQNDHKSLRTGLVNDNGIITAAYLCLVPRMNSGYLHYLLHAYDVQKVFYGMGGGVRQSIGFKDIRHMYIPVPPRAEQDQIVRFLDWKVAEINKLIGIRRKEIQGLEEMKSLIINTAVTKGITESCTKSSNVPWIGEIPVDWEIIPLKRCLKNITDVDHYMPPSVAHGIPYIMTGDLKEKVSEINFDNCKRISEQDYKVLSKKSKAQHGDIVFARYATIGTVSYVDEDRDFIVSYSCVILKPDSSMIDGRYLFYYLKSRSFSEDVRQYIKINTQGNVGIDSLKRTVLTRPSIDEQYMIVKYLDTKCKKIDELIRLKQSQVQAYQELKSVIISDAVTGKIDVRNITVPEYEHVDDIADDDAEDSDEKIEEMDEEA